MVAAATVPGGGKASFVGHKMLVLHRNTCECRSAGLMEGRQLLEPGPRGDGCWCFPSFITEPVLLSPGVSSCLHAPPGATAAAAAGLDRRQPHGCAPHP